MASAMGLTLLPADETDLLELVAIQFRAFECEPYHNLLFGYDSPAMRADCKRRHIKELESDTTARWMKIVDNESGKPVCAAQWKIVPQYIPKEAGDEKLEATWFEGEEREMAEFTIQNVEDRKARYVKEGHICK